MNDQAVLNDLEKIIRIYQSAEGEALEEMAKLISQAEKDILEIAWRGKSA